MKQGGGFPVKVLGEHQFTVPMNWKIQLENTTDAYHFPVVHKSFMQSLDGDAEEASSSSILARAMSRISATATRSW